MLTDPALKRRASTERTSQTWRSVPAPAAVSIKMTIGVASVPTIAGGTLALRYEIQTSVAYNAGHGFTQA